jgi:nucleotide-binding universal stress UspA family protein
VSAVADRDRPRGRASTWPDAVRPVVLGTLAARFDPEAERFAIASALDAGVALIVVNVVELKPYYGTMRLLGPSAATLPDEEDLEPVRATSARAAQLGVPTQLLRVTSSRPVRALLEIVAECDAGLLVFGPDARRVRPRKLRRAVAQVCERAQCLVWTPPGPEHGP